MATDEIYLMDSNTLIEPHKSYYAFDLIPSYWDKLFGVMREGRIALLDKVMSEINGGIDDLSQWIGGQAGFILCRHDDGEIVKAYGEVMNYLKGCGLYNSKAVTIWSGETVADPWLIAAAKAKRYILVTNEKRNGKLSRDSPNGKPKIPDVAGALGVTTCTHYDMMRALNIVHI